MDIETKALTPDLVEDYIDFFDHRAFSDGSPYYPCYCNAFNMSAIEIENMRKMAKRYGGGAKGWQKSLRVSAAQMVKEGRIRGLLAFDNGIAIGWCNANDRMNFYRVGEFDLDHVPEDRAPSDCQRERQIKSIVCFEISPEYRGKGIATQLLNQVCTDALAEGYEYVEAYPSDRVQSSLAFTGPVHMYEKAGFTEFSRIGSTIVMRKKLR
ncbi:MAG: GNAT family N-acetyltransferase [Lachnospiraceae bacterium]|nr:GNAT family N-acetyltransferase [Lachnospiraceae bacterium]